MPDGVTVNPEVVPQEIEVTVSTDDIEVEVAELVDMEVSVELVDQIIDVDVSAPEINIVCEFVGSHSSSGVEDVTFNGESIVEDRVAAIPTSLSSYSGDATHRLVTDAEKTSWNSKASINDSSTTSTTASWSASKLNSVIGNIESALDTIRGV